MPKRARSNFVNSFDGAQMRLNCWVHTGSRDLENKYPTLLFQLIYSPHAPLNWLSSDMVFRRSFSSPRIDNPVSSTYCDSNCWWLLADSWISWILPHLCSAKVARLNDFPTRRNKYGARGQPCRTPRWIENELVTLPLRRTKAEASWRSIFTNNSKDSGIPICDIVWNRKSQKPHRTPW